MTGTVGSGIGMDSCCLSGTLHQGVPKGRLDTIAGLPTYVSEPKDDSNAKSVVFISDIFGWEFRNTRLLADQYAAAGFLVYVPDFHQGQSLSVEHLKTIEPPLAEREKLSTTSKAANTVKSQAVMGPWLLSHRESVCRPLIDGFFKHLRTVPGTNRIGAVGFCWGGRYAILQAFADTPVDAVFAAHPSLVGVPGDFEPVTKPLSLALGTADSLLDEKTRGGIQQILSGKADVPTEIRIYEDQVHGFALRGDWSSEKDKEAMDEAERQGIAWLQKYLL